METKKNQQANLERSKAMFLFIGLIAAISLLIFAFSWNSEKEYGEKYDNDDFPEEKHVINTTHDEEMNINKPDKPIPNKVIAEIIKLSDDPHLIDTFELWTEYDIDLPDDPIVDEKIDEEIYYITDVMPVPIGGSLETLNYWILKHVEYPPKAKENGIEGTVHIRFEVTKKGKVGRIEVLNPSVDKLLQDAAVDVIKKVPDFKPGMHNGQYVSVWYSIPIRFVLQ